MRLPHWLALAAIAAPAASFASGTDGQSGTNANVQIPWSSADAGAAVLESGGLRLSATIGQPDAPTITVVQGGPLRLRAGYWLTPGEHTDLIFANGFETYLPNVEQGETP